MAFSVISGNKRLIQFPDKWNLLKYSSAHVAQQVRFNLHELSCSFYTSFLFQLAIILGDQLIIGDGDVIHLLDQDVSSIIIQ